MSTIIKNVDKYRDLIADAERYIWAHPETGYREVETTAYLKKTFEELGYDVTLADGITGFYTVLDTGREGPEVLVLAELDSVICHSHKDSNKKTGAVHACGHHAQCAALVGIAAALKEEGALDGLCGRIRLCAVPAEELLELEYRSELKRQGKIKYFGGKAEFLHRGYFDGVDIAIMVHTAERARIDGGSVGCIAKNIIYKGKSAHAGGAPWLGVNALYAATCGINAVNAIRETFREPDLIRVHPIMTSGGSMVNAIPEEARIESYIRGATFEAIAKANKKVDRALIGGALSLGANIEIIDIPGYSPFKNDENMKDVAIEAAEIAGIENLFITNNMITGSTDMGDLSSVMPTVQPYSAGSRGAGHSKDFVIADVDAACVKSAKWQLAMLELLLSDGAKRAKKIIDEFTPIFATNEEFFAYQDSLCTSGDRIVYNEDGTVEIKL